MNDVSQYKVQHDSQKTQTDASGMSPLTSVLGYKIIIYMSEVEDSSFINDIRFANEFKGISFSSFKRTEVKQALHNALYRGKIEPACYWSAELVCAGHYLDIWECILFFLGRYIHLGNPKMVIYLENRYQIFRNIVETAVISHEIQLRNYQNIRKLFAEVMCMCIQSPKKPSFETVKIVREDEFDTTTIQEHLQAKDSIVVDAIFRPKDPREYYIALNEFAYCLTQHADGLIKAYYWIEWIIEFDAVCRKRNNPCLCERRHQVPVSSNYQCDIIWLVWEILFHVTTNILHKGVFIENILNALQKLFCIKYTTGSCKRRRYLLYFATALVTEQHISQHVALIREADKDIIHMVVSKINKIYQDIKTKEISPNTEYLFDNVTMERDDRELQRSMKRLDMMQILG